MDILRGFKTTAYCYSSLHRIDAVTVAFVVVRSTSYFSAIASMLVCRWHIFIFFAKWVVDIASYLLVSCSGWQLCFVVASCRVASCRVVPCRAVPCGSVLLCDEWCSVWFCSVLCRLVPRCVMFYCVLLRSVVFCCVVS